MAQVESLRPAPGNDGGKQPAGGAAATALSRIRDLRIRRGAATADRAVSLVLAAVVAVEIVFIGFNLYARVDLTLVNAFTVSEKTARILNELDEPVKVTVFYGERYPAHAWAFQRIRDLLDEYRRASKSVDIEYVDPYSKREKADLLREKYGISEVDFASGVVVFTYKGQNKFVTDSQLVLRARATGDPYAAPQAFLGEEAFLSAILSLIEGKKPVVYIQSGHMESSIEDTSQIGFSFAAERLRRDNFEVKRFELKGEAVVPDDCDVLVVPGPEAVFAETEAYSLRKYVDRGGRILLLLPLAMEKGSLKPLDVKLDPVTDPFSITAVGSILVDPSNPPHPNLVLRIVVRDYNAEHPVSKPMTGQAEPKQIVLPFTRPLKIGENPPEGISVEAIATSPPYSIKKADIEDVVDGDKFEAVLGQFGTLARPGRDEVSGFPVAVAAERTTARADRRGRIIVVGNYLFASNYLLMTETYNVDFLLNAVNWLAERESHLGIEAKKPREISVRMTPAKMNHVFSLTVVIMPLTSLAFGVVVWIVRRR